MCNKKPTENYDDELTDSHSRKQTLCKSSSESVSTVDQPMRIEQRVGLHQLGTDNLGVSRAQQKECSCKCECVEENDNMLVRQELPTSTIAARTNATNAMMTVSIANYQAQPMQCIQIQVPICRAEEDENQHKRLKSRQKQQCHLAEIQPESQPTRVQNDNRSRETKQQQLVTEIDNETNKKDECADDKQFKRISPEFLKLLQKHEQEISRRQDSKCACRRTSLDTMSSQDSQRSARSHSLPRRLDEDTEQRRQADNNAVNEIPCICQTPGTCLTYNELPAEQQSFDKIESQSSQLCLCPKKQNEMQEYKENQNPLSNTSKATGKKEQPMVTLAAHGYQRYLDEEQKSVQAVKKENGESYKPPTNDQQQTMGKEQFEGGESTFTQKLKVMGVLKAHGYEKVISLQQESGGYAVVNDDDSMAKQHATNVTKKQLYDNTKLRDYEPYEQAKDQQQPTVRQKQLKDIEAPQTAQVPVSQEKQPHNFERTDNEKQQIVRNQPLEATELPFTQRLRMMGVLKAHGYEKVMALQQETGSYKIVQSDSVEQIMAKSQATKAENKQNYDKPFREKYYKEHEALLDEQKRAYDEPKKIEANAAIRQQREQNQPATTTNRLRKPLQEQQQGLRATKQIQTSDSLSTKDVDEMIMRKLAEKKKEIRRWNEERNKPHDLATTGGNEPNKPKQRDSYKVHCTKTQDQIEEIWIKPNAMEMCESKTYIICTAPKAAVCPTERSECSEKIGRKLCTNTNDRQTITLYACDRCISKKPPKSIEMQTQTEANFVGEPSYRRYGKSNARPKAQETSGERTAKQNRNEQTCFICRCTQANRQVNIKRLAPNRKYNLSSNGGTKIWDLDDNEDYIVHTNAPKSMKQSPVESFKVAHNGDADQNGELFGAKTNNFTKQLDNKRNQNEQCKENKETIYKNNDYHNKYHNFCKQDNLAEDCKQNYYVREQEANNYLPKTSERHTIPDSVDDNNRNFHYNQNRGSRIPISVARLQSNHYNSPENRNNSGAYTTSTDERIETKVERNNLSLSKDMKLVGVPPRIQRCFQNSPQYNTKNRDQAYLVTQKQQYMKSKPAVNEMESNGNDGSMLRSNKIAASEDDMSYKKRIPLAEQHMGCHCIIPKNMTSINESTGSDCEIDVICRHESPRLNESPTPKYTETLASPNGIVNPGSPTRSRNNSPMRYITPLRCTLTSMRSRQTSPIRANVISRHTSPLYAARCTEMSAQTDSGNSNNSPMNFEKATKRYSAQTARITRNSLSPLSMRMNRIQQQENISPDVSQDAGRKRLSPERNPTKLNGLQSLSPQISDNATFDEYDCRQIYNQEDAKYTTDHRKANAREAEVYYTEDRAEPDYYDALPECMYNQAAQRGINSIEAENDAYFQGKNAPYTQWKLNRYEDSIYERPADEYEIPECQRDMYIADRPVVKEYNENADVELMSVNSHHCIQPTQQRYIKSRTIRQQKPRIMDGPIRRQSLQPAPMQPLPTIQQYCSCRKCWFDENNRSRCPREVSAVPHTLQDPFYYCGQDENYQQELPRGAYPKLRQTELATQANKGKPKETNTYTWHQAVSPYSKTQRESAGCEAITSLLTTTNKNILSDTERKTKRVVPCTTTTTTEPLLKTKRARLKSKKLQKRPKEKSQPAYILGQSSVSLPKYLKQDNIQIVDMYEAFLAHNRKSS